MPVKAPPPPNRKQGHPPARYRSSGSCGAIARLVDFLMEDIAAYSTIKWVPPFATSMRSPARLWAISASSLVIDGLEGTFTKAQGLELLPEIRGQGSTRRHGSRRRASPQRLEGGKWICPRPV
jgi:hypothetical protein